MSKRQLIDRDTGEVLENPSKAAKNLDEWGREIPDPTPIAPPVGYFRQPSMVDIVREQVRQHLSLLAHDQGFETFEEADDFDVGDDYDPRSPYEENFEPTPAAELRRRASEDPEASGVQGASPPAQAPSPAPAAPAPEAPSPEAPKK